MIASGMLCALAAVQEAPEKLSLPLESARDVTSEGIAFVEAFAPAAECFVEQRVEVIVRFGLEETFAKTRMVQPFGTGLDVPVQLSAPGLGSAAEPGEPKAEAGALRPSFAMDEAIAHATRGEDRVVEGRRFQVYEVRKEARPASAGKLVIPPPVLAFAYATRFEDSFVGGRVPADREDAFVTGSAITLEVRPLPEEGRPKEFGGAVGSFSVRAEVEPREVAVGESLKLALVVEGQGNLEKFEAPRWKEIGGFRVLGMIDEKTPAARTMTYSLAPVSAKVWQVPAVEFAYFDPSPPAGYRVARTEPVDVKIREGTPSQAQEAQPSQQPPPSQEQPIPKRSSRYAWIGAFVAIGIVLLGILRRRK